MVSSEIGRDHSMPLTVEELHSAIKMPHALAKAQGTFAALEEPDQDSLSEIDPLLG